MMDEDSPKFTILELMGPDGEYFSNKSHQQETMHTEQKKQEKEIHEEDDKTSTKWLQLITLSQNKTKALLLWIKSNFFMDVSTQEGMILRSS